MRKSKISLMRKIIALGVCCIAMSSAMGATLVKDGPFSYAIGTGNNMIVLVLRSIAPTINGKALAGGDIIAAYTPSGLCVGTRMWPDTGNITITVWGDDEQTPAIDGAKAGDSLSFRVWDAATGQTGTAKVTWIPVITGGVFNRAYTYAPDAISGLSSLEATFEPAVPVIPAPVQSDTSTTATK
jgi:hypothetical protein